MKSLIVTAVVLSSFGMQTFAADQAPDKGKGSSSDQVSPAARDAREHLPLPGGKRPETNAPATASPRAAAPAPAATPKTAAPAPVEKAPPVRMTENKSPAAGAPIKATPPAQKTPVTAAPTQQAPTKQTSAQQTPATQKPPLVTKAPPTGPVIQQPPGKQGPAQKAPGNQVSRNQVPPGAQNSRPGAPAVIRPQVMPPNAQGKHALTPAQIHEVQLKNQRLAQQNPHVHNFVEQRGQFYREHYNAQLVRLQSRYAAPAFLSPLRLQYRPWIKVGFFAYAYPVRPVVEFYTYFSNPCVAWFYNDYDADFYQPYYGQYASRYPDLNRGYKHVGIYLPTEEFMTLNVALSEMPIEAQVNYRRAMTYLSDRLSERSRTPIGRHEVVVNHYQMLPGHRAVVIEGFVDREQTQIPFKALVDLNNADNSQLFALGAWKADQQPTAEEREDLNDLNDQVVEFGGALEAEPAS